MGTFFSRDTVKEAITEISTKSHEMIEFETASKWAARAVAAHKMYRETGDLQWLRLSTEFCHEAIEHAACAGAGMADVAREELRSAGVQ